MAGAKKGAGRLRSSPVGAEVASGCRGGASPRGRARRGRGGVRGRGSRGRGAGGSPSPPLRRTTHTGFPPFEFVMDLDRRTTQPASSAGLLHGGDGHGRRPANRLLASSGRLPQRPLLGQSGVHHRRLHAPGEGMESVRVLPSPHPGAVLGVRIRRGLDALHEDLSCRWRTRGLLHGERPQ